MLKQMRAKTPNKGALMAVDLNLIVWRALVDYEFARHRVYRNPTI